jgi:hypothetical protein
MTDPLGGFESLVIAASAAQSIPGDPKAEKTGADSVNRKGCNRIDKSIP